MSHLKVGIIMGSKSDLSVMSEAAKILEKLGLSSEVSIVSAHRTPVQMVEYAQVPDYGDSKSLLQVLEGQHICQGW